MVYKPGRDNTVADGLSWWAYPAGLADDTNSHGSDAMPTPVWILHKHLPVMFYLHGMMGPCGSSLNIF